MKIFSIAPISDCFRTMGAVAFIGMALCVPIFSSAADFDPFQSEDPYLALGIERSASLDEARVRYRELLKGFHPDRRALHGLESNKATIVTQNLNIAYAWIKKNHVVTPASPTAERASAASGSVKRAPPLAQLDRESVLRYAWNMGMNALHVIPAMNALLRSQGKPESAFALVDLWFAEARSNPNFILFYLEVARAYPDAGRIGRAGGFDFALLGPLRGRAHALLAAIASAHPEFAAAVNAILYPVTQPLVFESSAMIKAELRTLLGAQETERRRELGWLVRDAGDGLRDGTANRHFQEAVAQFIEEEFLRTGARIQPVAAEPFLNLLADESRAFNLRLALLRSAPDHAALVEGAIEAARALRAMTVPEPNHFKQAPVRAKLHDYNASLSHLLEALADGDARLSGGRRSTSSLQEMVLNLALRSHRSGNSDAKQLIRSVVDVVENAEVIENLLRQLEQNRLAEVIFGSLSAPQELRELMRSLRGGTARSCRTFF